MASSKGIQPETAAKWALFGLGLLVAKKITDVFGITKSAEEQKIYFNISKAYNNAAFNRDFTVLLQKLARKPQFKNLTASQLLSTQTNASKVANIAVEIYAAGAGAGTNEAVIYSQLRRLSNILELGLLNQTFLSLYKVSVIDFLADELDETELNFASMIINNLPEYTK